VRNAFWFSLGFIMYTYVCYPAAMWVLAKLRPRRWSVAPIYPSISIVLAVHNGAGLLMRKIEHLLNLDYANVQEIIIVSDGSTDGTAELLAQQHHERLRTIILKEHCGKAVAVNAGVAEANADVILFVDIRPVIAPGAIQHLVSNFVDPSVGCVTGELILGREGHDPSSAAIGGLYWRYEQWIRTCEALSDSTIGVYGGFYAIRRRLAVEQPSGMILDDLFQPLSIIRQGYRSVLDTKARVYDVWPQKIGDEFQRKVRTLAGNFQLFQRAPWTLSWRNRVLFQLLSHKVMRLMAPYLFILLLVSTAALSTRSTFFAAFAALQIGTWTLAVAGLRYRIPLLHYIAAPASALLVLNAAAVVGLYQFLFTQGPLWRIWNSQSRMAEPFAPDPEASTAPSPIDAAVGLKTGDLLHANSMPRQEVRQS